MRTTPVRRATGLAAMLGLCGAAGRGPGGPGRYHPEPQGEGHQEPQLLGPRPGVPRRRRQRLRQAAGPRPLSLPRPHRSAGIHQYDGRRSNRRSRSRPAGRR
ncbi:MAG: hypothetical protein MZV64_22685 [Ignavibacteriales bacterium]|nr:hypothetical protein [Ignavibacteriales bacterium]